MRFVEGDQLGERAHVAAALSEIGIQIGAQLDEHRFEGQAAGFAGIRQLDGIDDDRAGFAQLLQRGFKAFEHLRMAAALLAQHAEADACERKRRGRGEIIGEDLHEQRSIANGECHRSGGVLMMRDRDDAAAVDASEGRFEAHDAASARGTDDGAVCFRADGRGGESGGHRGGGAGTGAACGVRELVRIAREAAACAPAAR